MLLLTLLFNVSINATSVDPAQTDLQEQSYLGLRYLSKMIKQMAISDGYCCDWRFID